MTVYLREITKDDAKTLFNWQSNPEIRCYFRNAGTPSWDDHVAWLTDKLADPDTLLRMIMDGDRPMGTVRLERECPGIFEISILVDPAGQGRGLGLAALALARQEKPAAMIRAEVLEGNEASHALFKRAGYQLEEGRYVLHFGAVIRADGGPGVGLGHARRCFALGEALKSRMDVSVLAPCAELAALATEAGLIPVFCGEDEAAIMDKAEGAGVLIFDHYHLDMSALSANVLVAFDDTGTRPTPVDIVVNGSPAATEIDYVALGAKTILAGPDYQVVRADLTLVSDRDPYMVPRRVLVTIGGGDPHAMLPVLAKWLGSPRFAHLQIDLVVGPHAETPVVPDGVAVHKDPVNMVALIAQADVAVSAAGQTLMELLYCGVPTAALCLAENQAPNLKALEAEDCVLVAGNANDADWLESLDVTLDKLLSDADLRARLSQKAERLVDGKGAQRIATTIMRAIL